MFATDAKRWPLSSRFYFGGAADYGARHCLKLGIIDWAQITGWRGATGIEEQTCKRIEHDVGYIDNWSPSVDLRIPFPTMLRRFADKNAF